MKKTFIKILSLVLCVLMIVPMLFACDKNEATENADETTDNGAIIPEIEIPNFKGTVSLAMSRYGETMNISQEIYHYDGNLYIDVAEGLVPYLGVDKATLTICDKVVYVQYGEYKYKLDLGNINLKSLLAAFLADAPAESVSNEAVIENDATFMSSTSADSESVFFNSVTTTTDAKGNVVTTYSGIKAKVGTLIDYVKDMYGVGFDIDYDSFNLAISKTSDGKFAGINVGATIKMPVDYDEEADEVIYGEMSVSAGVGFEYGEAGKVNAPANADTYADVLPMLVQMAADYVFGSSYEDMEGTFDEVAEY